VARDRWGAGRIGRIDSAFAKVNTPVVLSEIDRTLLQRCLARKPRSWEEFVDRFLGLVVHVVNHTSQSRGVRLSDEDREDLVAEVFLAVVHDDFALLRHFRGDSSLATYLTVVARRVVVREMLRRKLPARNVEHAAEPAGDTGAEMERRMENREEVEALLSQLAGAEADVIRLYHLHGRSYQEISAETGLPMNTIGPTLSRARAKLRKVGVDGAPA
jgi:RNA polymerase sigma-70 factor, ECF subfamily